MNAVLKILITILVCINAFACEVTPPEQIVPATELVKRIKTIALAQVTSSKLDPDGYTVIYTFQTINTLKGNPEKTFTITGIPLLGNGPTMMDFDHHNDKAFWENGGGRSLHGTDCKIHPSFSVGAHFLIFLDQPYHVKSFELIIRTHGDKDVRDKWLSWVESQANLSRALP
jgi:hypothetical protein